jgi:CRP-like cAMP-binding protein
VTDRTEAAAHLSKVPIFSRLKEDVLQAIAEQSVDRYFAVGDSIAVNGAPNDGLLVIVEGEVEVTRHGRQLTVLTPGGFVGDLSLLDGEPHMVDAVATKPVTGVFLAGHQFRVVVKHYPEVSEAFVLVLVARIREIVQQWEDREHQEASGDLS